MEGAWLFTLIHIHSLSALAGGDGGGPNKTTVNRRGLLQIFQVFTWLLMTARMKDFHLFDNGGLSTLPCTTPTIPGPTNCGHF